MQQQSSLDFSCAVRARQSSLIQQNNRHTLDHPARSHPQQAKLANPQHGPLFPEASSSSQPYQLQPPPVRQRTVLPQNIQVALSAAVLYQQQQQQQQQPYLQQAPSTSVRHQAHNMLGNEGHVMDLSPSSVTSLASELSEYSDDSCSKEFTTLTTPLGSDVPTLDWVIYKMMEREKTQQLHREKIETCHLYELPIDPWKWTSTEVTKWATWFMRKTNPTTAQDVTTTFENSPITGESLAHFSETELKQYFGELSSQAHECLRLWLEGMSPRGYDIQRHLLDLERSKQTMLEQLIDVMNHNDSISPASEVENPSVTLTPPHSDYDVPLSSSSDDAFRNVIVQHIKPEYTAFPFSEHCMSEYQNHYNITPLKCPEPPYHQTQPDMSGSGGIFGPETIGPDGMVPDNLGPFIDKEYKLDIESDDEPGKLFTVKEEIHIEPPPIKRKRGRPRKPRFPKQKRDQPILYKFILKHLNNPSGDSGKYLNWVNKPEGLFRFYSARKDEFAEMWGRFKGKREHMTYQNMARALRNYTRGNRKIMTSVRKKLHYKFTPLFIQ
ncbi:ETS-related transcription factor Elf-3 [Strongylocentrotus purpuratus]|uniref:ETS domain-containing protein n=1 Tax=Strongylocentrotus purpuratus TaxID=7668 RepID=A0A7M7RER7_STRPU|nr:ETS-related transcription factor Elf-3 [Strongylocentrotus purpuratus]|eukprot:XP_790907.3 PREDICTED: ETS-related transcription factor Elf-3 [Strongylocentrotus purpuratus]